MRPVTRFVGVLAALTLVTSGAAHAQELEANGWIVFEHFGQAPDGSTPEFDFDLRQIWLVHPDGSDLHELAPRDPPHGKSSPDVSPDGTHVVFNTWSPLARVWEVSIDGDDMRLVSEGCSGRDRDCQAMDPAYAPDGQRLALVHVGWEARAGYTEIGVRELDGGPATYFPETRVPFEVGDVAQPSWSPDGQQIVYHVNGERSTGYPASIRLWIVGADGGAPAELATPAGIDAADADWSPDGTRIVFSTMGYRESEGAGVPNPRIYSVDPDGSDPLLLCEDVVDPGCWAPSWLPDGRHILYWGFRTWNLMAADGSGKHAIDPAHLTWFADGLGFGYFATWAPAR